MASKLQAAQALIARGLKVFPIQEGAKFPPLVSNWPALATSDAWLVNAQWSDVGTPHANIGIHCDGMIVLDVDTKKGGPRALELLRLTEGLPDTLETTTPSGGQHLFFRLPDGHAGCPNGVDVLGPGVDVRSSGGYVVAPGSTVAAGVYAWRNPGAEIAPAPAWLIKRLGTAVASQHHEVHSQADAPEQSVARALEWLRTAERSVKGQGGDQAAFRVACRLRDLGMSYGQACELMRSEAWDHGCGWRDGRLEEKPIRSAYTYAQNEDGGGRGVVEDDLPIPSRMPAAPPSKPKAPRKRLMRADEYAAEPGRQHYVVKNLLNRASYAVAYGPPGAGKTFVMLDVGYHTAAGKPWMGHNVRGGPVLYLAYEGVGGLRKRAQALQKKYGANLGPLYIVAATMNLREQPGRQELGQILAEMPAPPVLVIVDTFARALMGGDENSAQDVGAFNDAIAKLIDHTGACVVLIHHSGKNKAAGARGSSAILGAIDTELEIDGNRLTPSKQRDLECLPPIGFKLRPVTVGIDEDGDDEKSCVVEPLTASAQNGRPLTGKGAHAFSILSDMTGEANNPVSKGAWLARMQEEGFAKATAYEWAGKLKVAGKATEEDGYVTRRLA